MGRKERERVFDSHVNNVIEMSSSGEHDASDSAPCGGQQHQTIMRSFSAPDRTEQHADRSSTAVQNKAGSSSNNDQTNQKNSLLVDNSAGVNLDEPVRTLRTSTRNI